MTISGVILTLVDAPALAMEAVDRVAEDPRLTIGRRDGPRLAVVAETSGQEEDRRLWHELRENPGIAHVDITGVFFDDDAASQTRGTMTDGAAASPALTASHNTVRSEVFAQSQEEWNDDRAH